MEGLKNTEDLANARTFDRESQAVANPIADNIDNIREKVAKGLKSAASSLKQTGPQTGTLSDYVSRASVCLDKAGDYLEEVTAAQFKSDIQHQVRANPGRSLLIAGAAGLIVGSLMRRR